MAPCTWACLLEFPHVRVLSYGKCDEYVLFWMLRCLTSISKRIVCIHGNKRIVTEECFFKCLKIQWKTAFNCSNPFTYNVFSRGGHDGDIIFALAIHQTWLPWKCWVAMATGPLYLQTDWKHLWCAFANRVETPLMCFMQGPLSTEKPEPRLDFKSSYWLSSAFQGSRSEMRIGIFSLLWMPGGAAPSHPRERFNGGARKKKGHFFRA